MNNRLTKCLLPFALLSAIANVQAEDVVSDGKVQILQPDYAPIEDTIIVPKQTLIMTVDAVSTTWFTAPPAYPQWEMPGAVIVNSESQNLALQYREKGKTWAGVRREFLLVPQKTGKLQLPRSEIVLTPALTDSKQTVSVSSAPFTVELPAGATDIDRFLPATRLQLTETIEPDVLENLKTGDAIVRKVTIEADGVMATFIPAINSGDVPQGLELYASRPEVSNVSTARGDFIGGKRTETFTYMAHDAGSYTLPGIQVKWWNLQTKAFETATLPPVTFSVAAAANAGDEARLQQSIVSRLTDNLGSILLGLTALIVLLSLVLRYKLAVIKGVNYTTAVARQTLHKIRTSEPVWFYRMLLAKYTGQNKHAIHLYHQWRLACKAERSAMEPEIIAWLAECYADQNSKYAGKADRQAVIKNRLVSKICG